MSKPNLAVWKFASCDGCQLSLLDAEEELLDVVGAIDVAYFPEASRDYQPGPYTVSLIEGSVTTPEEAERVHLIRESSTLVITLGACATSGGIQALRNLADVDDYIRTVYARPDYIETLKQSTPISDHIDVDYELRGCPINKRQLLEVLSACLVGRRPNLPTYSVCAECKRRGNPCVMVAHGTPCLGPITQAGCEAICPAYNRGCFGCFGPTESPNTEALAAWWSVLGVADEEWIRGLRTYNVNAPDFAKASGSKGDKA